MAKEVLLVKLVKESVGNHAVCNYYFILFVSLFIYAFYLLLISVLDINLCMCIFCIFTFRLPLQSFNVIFNKSQNVFRTVHYIYFDAVRRKYIQT